MAAFSLANEIIICNCISTLVNKTVAENYDTSAKEFKSSHFTLQRSVDAVTDRVLKCPEVLSLITATAPVVLQEKELDVEWQFVEWCLVLLDSLGRSLRDKAENRTRHTDKDGLGYMPSLSSDTLCVKHQKDVLTCVQSVVALGFYPSLIPGIGVPLCKRTGFKGSLSQPLNFTQRHRRLVTCTTVLLRTAESPVLSAIILPRHLGDLLTALVQLCHAPIKKMPINAGQEDSSAINSDTPSNIANNINTENGVPACSRCSSVQEMFLMIQDTSDDASSLIAEMWEDRRFLNVRLEELQAVVHQPLLVRELLTLQSVSSSSSFDVQNRASAPGWLRKVCGFMLTSCLIRPGGVHAVIQGILDSDVAASEADWMKYEAVAKMIANAPLQSFSKQDYYKKICLQVLALLKMKNIQKQKILLRIVSTLVQHLSQNQPALAEEFIFKPLFQPLFVCFEIKDSLKEEIVATEDAMMESIEALHKIFILGLEPNASIFHYLLPAYLPFFSLLVDTHGGVSYLRNYVMDLMIMVLKKSENPVHLLLAAAFGDGLRDIRPVVVGIHFRHGSSGGVEIISSQRYFHEDWLDEDRKKALVIFGLLEKLNNSRTSARFFLELLERLTAVLEESSEGPNLSLHNESIEIRATEEDMSQKLRQNLLLLNLLQELSNSVGETLLEDRIQAISFIKATLERGTQMCLADVEADSFKMETLLLAMGVLTMFLDQKDQLNEEDWLALKSCLPFLSDLASDRFSEHVRSLSKELAASIATRGAAGRKRREEASEGDSSVFEKAWQDVHSAIVPERGHGLMALKKLLQKKDPETLREKDKVFKIFEERLNDSDSYVYLIAIQALVALADIDAEGVVTILSKKFTDNQSCDVEIRLKIGEVLVKVCRNLGDIAHKYRSIFLNTFLSGTKDEDSEIRASSLSNLGELCKCLKFSLGSCLHEILHCLSSVLQSDKSVEVRRAAVMVTTFLLRGLGRDTLTVLESELRDIYRQLKMIYTNDRDDVVRLHSQLALEEINNIIRQLFSSDKTLTKQIRILDPF